MIQIKGNKATFTDKDYTVINKEAKRLKLSLQDLFTALLWEYVLKTAREKASNGR